jgi:hypothetical protein
MSRRLLAGVIRRMPHHPAASAIKPLWPHSQVPAWEHPTRHFNLDSSIERARWRVWAGGWREATTLRAGARKEERQSQTRAQTCKRARSGPTQWVNVTDGTNASNLAASRGLTSGQPRNQGSTSYPFATLRQTRWTLERPGCAPTSGSRGGEKFKTRLSLLSAVTRIDGLVIRFVDGLLGN